MVGSPKVFITAIGIAALLFVGGVLVFRSAAFLPTESQFADDRAPEVPDEPVVAEKPEDVPERSIPKRRVTTTPPVRDPPPQMPDPEEEERLRQERKEAARKLFLQLRDYGGDLSEEESDHYDFLVSTLSSASNAAEDWVLGNLEGDFLNRSFFVGRRGREESFRKAFSKLLEGLAGGMAPDTKLQVLQLTEDAFREGVQEMQEIETVMLGAPLEGADNGYWDDREMPDSNLLSDAWAARNSAFQELYWNLLDSFSSLLTEEQFETLASNLDVLGFETEEETEEQ